jgi:hypothetical protein
MLPRLDFGSCSHAPAYIFVALMLWVACLPAFRVFGAISVPAGFRSGLCLSKTRPLTIRQQTGLFEQMRQRTGFAELHLDEDGFLALGDRAHISGGSPTARALLLAVVDSRDLFIIESHESEADLAFARVRAKFDYVSLSTIPEHRRTFWSIEIDFDDYGQLRGERDAISAFDPCLCLLHELAHAVFNFRDSVGEDDSLGDCERYINQIRRELRLPERQTYESVSRYAVSPNGAGRRLLGELTFFCFREGNRAKTLRLSFDVEDVVRSKFIKARTSK